MQSGNVLRFVSKLWDLFTFNFWKIGCRRWLGKGGDLPGELASRTTIRSRLLPRNGRLRLLLPGRCHMSSLHCKFSSWVRLKEKRSGRVV